MTNTCATCDFYRASTDAGHGTCHVNPPGTLAHSGFPIIAASDWCSKGATAGKDWSGKGDMAIQGLRGRLSQAEDRAVGLSVNVDRLLARNLWQRIRNTVPWESDRNSLSAEDAKRHFDSPDGDKESPRR